VRRKFNIAIVALGAMIVIIAAIAWAQAASTVYADPADMVNRCSTCHQMSTEVASWQEGNHKNVACTACHAGPGISGWVHEKVATVRMALAATRGEKRPSEISADVPDQRCLDCHARQMPYVMQDIEPLAPDAKLPVPVAELQKMPAMVGHDLHLTGKPDMRCTDCHAQTSHGPRMDTTEHRDMFHGKCQDCHDAKKVAIKVQTDVSCAACHADLGAVAPPDHKRDWRQDHGKASQKGTCGECHLSSSAGPHGKLSQPASFSPASSVDACQSCHQVPMPHPKDWLTRHNTEFKNQSAVCATCHGTRGQDFNAKFTGEANGE